MRNIEEINLQFAKIKENVLKRPAMYFGMNEQWICRILNLLVNNGGADKITIRITESTIRIEVPNSIKFRLTSDFRFFQIVTDVEGRWNDTGIDTLLFCSRRIELNCELEDYGFSLLSISNNNLSISESRAYGFSIEAEYDEYFLNYISYIPHRLRENIRNWLIFHPTVKVELFLNQDPKAEILQEPQGVDVLFDAFSRFYSMYHPPFRGSAKSGNVEVRIILGFHDAFDVDVKSYLNGRRLLYDQGEHVHTLNASISEKKMKENLKLNGSYIALIFIDIPDSEVEFNSPISDFKPGNQLIFDLIEKIIDEQLHEIEYWGEQPFSYDSERKFTTQH